MSGLRQCNEQWLHGDFGFFPYLLVGTFLERLDFTWVTSFLFWFSDGMADSATRDLCRCNEQLLHGDFEFFLYLLVGASSEIFGIYMGNFHFSFGFLMAWPTLQREAFADGLM